MTTVNPTQIAVQRAHDLLRVPRIRTMREFAEQELVIPDGPFKGQRFRTDRQPFTRLWLDEVDSGRWNRFVSLGPTQSGKTLLSFVLPAMYHLFEHGETIVCAVPTGDMIRDKWRVDLKPAIEASRYRDLIPKYGAASRGGTPTAITFANGAEIRWMTGGGSDKTVAGFTTRVVCISETDGMDEAGEVSREADRITQIEARTRAFGDRKRVYMECTVSIETGRTWVEYKGGSDSKIVRPCPHCSAWVTPEREHITGWQEAEDEHEAREKSEWHCPDCGETWSDTERRRSNARSRLLHGGMEMSPDGEIVGPVPRSNTLGFRWTAADNHFVDAGLVGLDEWRASRSHDEDNAEREMRQFVWALPYVPPIEDLNKLDKNEICRRVSKLNRGIVPPGCERITVGVDMGKWLCHWVALAWDEHGAPHVLDYDKFEPPSDSTGDERAQLIGLREFRDSIRHGWKLGEKKIEASAVFIDAGWLDTPVYQFLKDAQTPNYFYACQGHSSTRNTGMRASYVKPRTKTTDTKLIGEHYHIVKIRHSGNILVEVDADYWKSWLHSRLTTPIGNPGAMTLFAAAPHEHLKFAAHLTNEKQIEEYIAGKGLIVRWERISKNNHWLDAGYLACCAGWHAGVRHTGEKPKHTRPGALIVGGGRRSDGRGWFDR